MRRGHAAHTYQQCRIFHLRHALIGHALSGLTADDTNMRYDYIDIAFDTSFRRAWHFSATMALLSRVHYYSRPGQQEFSAK